ncbi:MAG TPA: YraN family protein [Gammaproteobacteria bacterium]|nr:YraN family protein [Gammaproteobacteria bacterium]HCG71117.1 YraN family protein [Gammaproteobacteria bacterium]
MQLHWSESLAAAYLRYHGLNELARNHRCRYGEIDLIMRDGRGPQAVIVFIEVRYRQRSDFGAPEETVIAAKQRRILLTANHYLQAQSCLDHITRFDVIAISQPHYLSRIRWIQDAFA